MTLYRATERAGPDRVDGNGYRLACFSARAPFYEKPNEDSAGWIELGPGHGVFMVADGLGGLPGGADVSALAVNTITDFLAGQSAGEDIGSAIQAAIEKANRRILAHASRGATTLALAELKAGILRPYLVGDSSLLVTGQRGAIRYRSIPHSPVGEMLDAGLVDELEALNHGQRNIVSNVLGSEEMHIEIGPPVKLRPKDTVVLASDGLGDNLLDAEIIEGVRTGHLEQSLATLVDRCQAVMREGNFHTEGHPDDLTVLLLRMERSR